MATSAVFAVASCTVSVQAQSLESFYTGKTLSVLVSSDPGGGYDAQARLMARHIGRFLPGKPSAVVQNMPGGGGIVAANYLYNVAAQDGSVLAVIQRGVVTAELTGLSGVRFEIRKFTWVGNLASENSVLVAWHTAPVKSTADLFTTQMIVGGTGPTSDSEMGPRLYNAILGTKLKIISGYKGASDVILAMEKGELEGSEWSWSNIKTRGVQYLEGNKIVLLMQSALTRAPDLAAVPTEMEFAKSESDREVIQLFSAQKTIARPVMAGPNVPPERRAALRRAFVDMAADEQFKADAEKGKLEVDPMPGDAVEKVIELIATTPRDVADRFGAAVNPKK